MPNIEGRPAQSIQPVLQKFDAGLPGGGVRPTSPSLLQASGERQLTEPAMQFGGERRNPFSLEKPIDLVGSIRAAVEQARAEWPLQEVEFNPAWWLQDQISRMYNDANFDSKATGIFALPPELRETQEEKRDFLHGFRVAWSLVAYEQLDGERNGSIYEDTRNFTDIHNTTSLTLSTLGVTLLDAMAEAIALPNYAPGRVAFDLYPFTGEAAEEKIKKNATSLCPSNEEVRRAITPKREHVIDEVQ